MLDKFKDECGVFGIFGHPEAANMTYLGLYALQHRGQESGGIAASDGTQVRVSRAMGMSPMSSTPRRWRACPAPGRSATCATRPRARASLLNAQPILIDCAHGQIAIGHNGNLVNAQELRDELVRQGSIFQSSSDTEVVLHLYARSKAPTIEEAIVESVSQAQGAFSFVLLTRDKLIAVRDPHGFRPLALGRLGDAMVVCSETCAMDLIGATYVRDVEPGEVLVISEQGMRSIKPFAPAPLAHCVFEHVYFARPDSYVFGKSVNEVRTNLGRILALEQPVDADVVVPVPDSGVCAAMGYAEESGIPLRMGLIRNHYVGRTFIEPQSAIRHFGVRVKLNPVQSILDGQRVILIDDSIVRGTTSRKIVKMVRAAGAREVHVRISCPPTISPCFYGIDTPRRSELIAATHTHRRDHEVSGRGQRRLFEPRGIVECRRLGARLLLHVLLHRPLPGRVPARRGQLPAAGVEARQDRGGRGVDDMTKTQSTAETRPQTTPLRDRWFAPAVLLGVLAFSAIVARRPGAPGTASRAGGAASGGDRQARRSRLCDPQHRRPDGPPRSGGAGGSRAAADRRRAHRRLRALSRARAADRLQRSAHQGRDARVADAAPTIGCARSPTASSSTTRIARWCRRCSPRSTKSRRSSSVRR